MKHKWNVINIPYTFLDPTVTVINIISKLPRVALHVYFKQRRLPNVHDLSKKQSHISAPIMVTSKTDGF
jgi:hypothetical protein